jgi:hypothetical protein
MVISPGGGVAEAVADALPGLQMLRRDQLRGERHHGLQAELLGALVGERRAAVEHDAGAHPLAARFRKAQQSGRVGERALLHLERLTSWLNQSSCAWIPPGPSASAKWLISVRLFTCGCMRSAL